jgi:inosose dehydratase
VTASILERLAAAPISWGICEVPGWGEQLPPDRVLAEMASIGITATELGALGWLPVDAHQRIEMLSQHGLSLLGGFVPVMLHDADQFEAELATATQVAGDLAASGGRFFVAAVVASHQKWERLELDDAGWERVYGGLRRLDEICASYGLTQVLHPHVDTIVERAADVQRILDNTGVSFCLDTGHLAIGGYNPVDMAEQWLDRVGLVHIKDIDAALADRLMAGELTLREATVLGLFPSAGQGAAPIADTVRVLESGGYSGWYVLEQDLAIVGTPPRPGEGPVLHVKDSVEYITSLRV